jgi:hypothetical protein
MKLRDKLAFSILIICAFLITSCAATKITNSWRDNSYQGKTEKIAVIMVAKTPKLRKMFEGRFAAELNARGNKVIQSHKIITLDELHDIELVKSRIKSTGADTVLISRLVGSKTSDAYVGGGIHSVPLHYYGWGTYYEVLFIDYGYTADLRTSFIETNLYDTKTEKLIWFAHSETERAEGEQQLINKFIDIILKKLSSDKII